MFKNMLLILFVDIRCEKLLKRIFEIEMLLFEWRAYSLIHKFEFYEAYKLEYCSFLECASNAISVGLNKMK